MGTGKISKKQKEILEFMKSQILSKGLSALQSERSVRPLHLKSTSSVHAHLETLERERLYSAEILPSPEPLRFWMITFNLTRPEMVNVPMIGRCGSRLSPSWHRNTSRATSPFRHGVYAQ